jgi:hypothetical protein
MRLGGSFAIIHTSTPAGGQCSIPVAYLAKGAASYSVKHLIFLCSREIIPNESKVIVIRAAGCMADHHCCCLTTDTGTAASGSLPDIAGYTSARLFHPGASWRSEEETSQWSGTEWSVSMIGRVAERQRRA